MINTRTREPSSAEGAQSQRLPDGRHSQSSFQCSGFNRGS
jgi:hypothetical protein